MCLFPGIKTFYPSLSYPVQDIQLSKKNYEVYAKERKKTQSKAIIITRLSYDRYENHPTGSFKIMIINMLKSLKKKVGNMQDPMSNYIRERKTQTKMLKMKSTVMKLHNDFGRLTSTLNSTNKSIS